MVTGSENRDALAPKIIFEDTHLLVISKPAGFLSQGESTGDVNLVDWCREYFGRNYVGLVHRLDRGTSGLMVVAKRSKAAERLSESLKRGELVRNYQALLNGRLSAPAEWMHWLKKNEATNTSAVVLSGVDGAKEARLKVTPVQAYSRSVVSGTGASVGGGKSTGEYTLAEFELDTGRSHQIRVQASAMRHALVGDSKYGGGSELPRPALHSFFLKFPHPMTKGVVEFRDELPADIAQFLRGLK